jgi:hypothetical protein
MLASKRNGLPGRDSRTISGVKLRSWWRRKARSNASAPPARSNLRFWSPEPETLSNDRELYLLGLRVWCELTGLPVEEGIRRDLEAGNDVPF